MSQFSAEFWEALLTLVKPFFQQSLVLQSICDWSSSAGTCAIDWDKAL